MKPPTSVALMIDDSISQGELDSLGFVQESVRIDRIEDRDNAAELAVSLPDRGRLDMADVGDFALSVGKVSETLFPDELLEQFELPVEVSADRLVAWVRLGPLLSPVMSDVIFLDLEKFVARLIQEPNAIQRSCVRELDMILQFLGLVGIEDLSARFQTRLIICMGKLLLEIPSPEEPEMGRAEVCQGAEGGGERHLDEGRGAEVG